MEIIQDQVITTTLVKAENPDDAMWLLSCEFRALGYDMYSVKMRITNEQELLPSV